MIATKIPYLDGQVNVTENEPTTLQEICSLVGELEVVQRFVKHYRYHYKYPRVYDAVSDAIVNIFPKVEKETSFDHINRFRKLHEHGVEMCQILFTKYATEIPLTPKGERGGQGKVSQGALDAAAGYFAKGQESVTNVVQSIESVLVGYEIARDVEGNVTLEGLARGIQRLNRQLQQQAKDKAKTILS